jgi:hypothetical protein
MRDYHNHDKKKPNRSALAAGVQIANWQVQCFNGLPVFLAMVMYFFATPRALEEKAMRSILAALLLLAGTMPALVQEAQVPGGAVKKGVHRFVASGKSTVIAFYATANPDCASAGEITVRVTKQPEHGNVAIVDTTDFPVGFSEPFAHCDWKKTRGVRVTYKSAPKFIGDDLVELLVLLPDGRAWEVRMTIDVK